jgi:hypothetical protein
MLTLRRRVAWDYKRAPQGHGEKSFDRDENAAQLIRAVFFVQLHSKRSFLPAALRASSGKKKRKAQQNAAEDREKRSKAASSARPHPPATIGSIESKKEVFRD